MNKLVTVLGVAAVATLAGCKDPNYKPMSDSSQDDVMVVEPAEPQNTPAPVLTTPSCKCPPGTRHVAPCACGAADCQCIVEVTPVAVPTPPPVEPAYTTYIVQNGDYLAKISKKFNVTISSIKRINGLKSDVIRVGQKLKLPGKLDVGVQKAPVVSSKAPKAASASAEYKGATKEYVVKGGDTLGAIAYSNGINIRQLKNVAETVCAIEAGKHTGRGDKFDVDSVTLRQYLPNQEENLLPATVAGRNESLGNNSEREAIIRAIYQLRQDVDYIKGVILKSGTVPQQSPAAIESSEYNYGKDGDMSVEWKENQGVGLQDDMEPEEQDINNLTAEDNSIRQNELELMSRVLKKHNGNRKAAAEELQISERTLYRKIKQYNL